jgi:ribosomal protein L32
MSKCYERNCAEVSAGWSPYCTAHAFARSEASAPSHLGRCNHCGEVYTRGTLCPCLVMQINPEAPIPYAGNGSQYVVDTRCAYCHAEHAGPCAAIQAGIANDANAARQRIMDGPWTVEPRD